MTGRPHWAGEIGLRRQGRRLLFGYKLKLLQTKKICRLAQSDTMTESYVWNLCGMEMDYRLESDIWMLAQQSVPADEFVVLISTAVQTYKRFPGLHELDRVYARDIGDIGIEILGAVLSRAGIAEWSSGDSFVTMRAPLREHLYGYLQRHLMKATLATDDVVDNQMARDLGICDCMLAHVMERRSREAENVSSVLLKRY
ncbi:hypothetical protein [Pseudomonas syringae]|uniref:hypothetical protein n=1 Tax=Pseudomonas syringae TaxID=317 RepID=UPI001F3A9DEE|nr:hypothetical protein [Pseudomonas syringae]